MVPQARGIARMPGAKGMTGRRNSVGWRTGALAALVLAGTSLVAFTLWLGVPDPKGMAPGMSQDVGTDDHLPDAAAEIAESEPAPQTAPGPVPPRFDVVRVEAGGDALVAGRALAGSLVGIEVAGERVAQTRTGQDGRFAAFFTLAPADTPLPLRLIMETGAGVRVVSEGTVLVAPVAPAPARASEDTEADPAPTATTAPPVSGDLAPRPPVVPTAGIAPVAPAAAPAVLMAGAEGVRVLQPPAGELLPGSEVVMIDAISYDAGGRVHVSGRGDAGASFRLYLDNTAIGRAQADAQGHWRLSLNGISPGLYTLRVDQIAEAGHVGARFETPFLRERAERLADMSAEMAGSTETGGEAAGSGAAGARAAPHTPEMRLVTVQPGYTLWGIADRAYGRGFDYIAIFNANRDQIQDPDLIYPGQVLDLPRQGQDSLPD
ncbi:nucleoid-associated protein YgaU [Rhodovulum bhavnagarense]|uniref:Nucleoid-associated protein YgaU n=2 Tax=Rhodovulum bhavnagarense TaxID=992286 RepID=A0A4R2RGL2_9RHOB|nr:nucleoid-associated protein YgaU [Rhodovulum bhavnagarense]